jgi:hypothetical protein
MRWNSSEALKETLKLLTFVVQSEMGPCHSPDVNDEQIQFQISGWLDIGQRREHKIAWDLRRMSISVCGKAEAASEITEVKKTYIQ